MIFLKSGAKDFRKDGEFISSMLSSGTNCWTRSRSEQRALRFESQLHQEQKKVRMLELQLKQTSAEMHKLSLKVWKCGS